MSKIELAPGIQLHLNRFKMAIFRLHYSADPRKGSGEKVFVPEIGKWLSPWAKNEYDKTTDKSYYLQEYEIDFGATAGALIYNLCEEYTLEDEFIVPPNWTRYMALDPHPVKPHAALWLAVDPYDEWHVYREYWPSDLCFRYEDGVLKGSSAAVSDKDTGMPYKMYAECLYLLESDRNPQNGGKREEIERRVIDYAARAQGQGDSNSPTNTNAQMEFEKAADEIAEDKHVSWSLDFADAKKDKEVGYLAVNTALKPREIIDPRFGQIKRSQLRIMKQRCPELIFQLKHHRKRKPTTHEMETEDPIIKALNKRCDLVDCLRYIVVSEPEYVEPVDTESESTWRPLYRGIGF